MEELIAKRKEYFAELAKIYEKVEERAKEYFNEKVQALMAEKEEKKKEFLKEYQADLDLIAAKIKLIDEIIAEQMPEAKPLNDLMAKEPEVKEEQIVEEVKEEPVVEGDHIEGVATLSEPDAEGFQEFIAPEGYEGEEVKPAVEEVKVEETVAEPIVEEVKEENIIAVEEVKEVPEEAQVVDCVEILPEEPIAEPAPIEEPVAEPMVEEVKEEPKHPEARPGMPEILNPR